MMNVKGLSWRLILGLGALPGAMAAMGTMDLHGKFHSYVRALVRTQSLEVGSEQSIYIILYIIIYI